MEFKRSHDLLMFYKWLKNADSSEENSDFHLKILRNKTEVWENRKPFNFFFFFLLCLILSSVDTGKGDRQRQTEIHFNL